MAITALCECGQSYQLKDEFAGKRIACPSCKSAITVPASSRVAQADPIFDRDKFLIRQKKISLATRYFIGDAVDDQEIAFVVRPTYLGRMLLLIFLSVVLIFGVIAAAAAIDQAFGQRNEERTGMLVVGALIVGGLGFIGLFVLLAPKRNVSFFRDRAEKQRLLTVRQDFKFALVNAKYTVLDAAGEPIAEFHKNYLYNFIRRRWRVSLPDGTPLCVAIEDSILLSILRRFLGPMFGLLRTNFLIQSPDFERTIGEFNRKLTLFDKYVLDLRFDPNRLLDRRIALALGVMLDTGEHR